jgi:hypothetical protein
MSVLRITGPPPFGGAPVSAILSVLPGRSLLFQDPLEHLGGVLQHQAVVVGQGL